MSSDPGPARLPAAARLSHALVTPAGTALREAAGAVAGIGGGAFIISVMHDPAIQIITVLPVMLGASSLVECFRTVHSILRARRSAAAEAEGAREADVVLLPCADSASDTEADTGTRTAA